MARYKATDRSPRFLPVDLAAQLVPGSFEHALDYLIDTEIDVSGIAKRYVNDETGAPAYDPALMLKIVLLAYGRRIAIVEPVFANLRHNKRLDRFTLRTRSKVNAQWNLYCLVHNIEKLAHHGYRK